MSIKYIIASFITCTGLASATLLTVPVSAQSSLAEQNLCEGSGGTYNAATGTCTTDGDTRTVSSTLIQIIDTLMFLIGAIAVLMIVIGGIRYVTSAGDQSGVKDAKNTIIYALVGVIVAFLAWALVKFIIDAF